MFVTDEVIVDALPIDHGSTEDLTSTLAHSQLFGQMVVLAQPVIAHYHGDLYNDAMWIHKHLPAQLPQGGWPIPADQDHSVFIFYYGVRDTGTSIGTDLDLVSYNNPNVYMFTVRRDTSRPNRDTHTVTITRLKRSDAQG